MTVEKVVRQYGLWDSPITPASLAQGLRLSDVWWDSDGETVVWLEGRSAQGTLVAAPPHDAPRDLTDTLSVRARVGYGGGDFTVAGGQAYFVADGRIYRQALTYGAAKPLIPKMGEVAAPRISPDDKWLVYVYSYERQDGLAIVDTAGQTWPQKLVHGEDFYMQLCWHPDGDKIAWISWNHPQMPWDGTWLRMAHLLMGDGAAPRVVDTETLAGNENVAIFQPEFSPDGKYLTYISNETGWGNLYLYDLTTKTHRALTQETVEMGQPAWAQGLRSYGFSSDSRKIYYLRNERGFFRLWVYHLDKDTTEPLNSGLEAYTWIDQVAVSPKSDLYPPSGCLYLSLGCKIACLASAGTCPPRVIVYCDVPRPSDKEAGKRETPIYVLKRSTTESVSPAALSAPQPISWLSDDSTEIYGLYHPPASNEFVGRGAPPLVVLVHGGPTGQSQAKYNSIVQFLATRGYAVLAVNYRGSTGYGKEYVDALRGNWGIHDVEDSISGAEHLVAQGLADPRKLVIMGGSAGGFTVLQALVTHPGFFRAGVCLYGVSNQFTMAADTHKFEERYLDSLLGPLPEASAVYRARSPIFFADKISDPIAVYQGEIDRVVPRDQADTIVESLKARNVPHVYHVYEGEGHGWRKAETIEHFYKSLDEFLKQHVIFA